MSMVYSYDNYEDIPVNIQEYILTIANKNNIRSLNLSDINNYLNGYEEYINKNNE